MTFKQFLKPDRRKIVVLVGIFIILIRFVMVIEITKENCGFVRQKGFPFHYFWSMGGVCEKGLIGYGEHFYLGYFILNILIWALISYLLSCLIIWIWDKAKKKS